MSALSRAARRPGTATVVAGASRPEQLEQNIAALDVGLTAAQQAGLDEADAPPRLDSSFLSELPTARIVGGQRVAAW